LRRCLRTGRNGDLAGREKVCLHAQNPIVLILQVKTVINTGEIAEREFRNDFVAFRDNVHSNEKIEYNTQPAAVGLGAQAV